VAVMRDRQVRGRLWWIASRGHEIPEPVGPAREDCSSREWQCAERLVLTADRYRSLNGAL